jgi:hypothetical protein
MDTGSLWHGDSAPGAPATDDPLPQPWEGIDGTERTSFLLSLEDEATEHREALMRMARHLRTACLVGNPAPVVGWIWDRASKPEPGDLVVEMTRAVHRLDCQGFGILLARRMEAAGTVPDEVWYIQYGSHHRDIARWQNCEFMTLPVTIANFERPAVPADDRP